MKTKKLIIKIIASLLSGAIVTLIAWSGLLSGLDGTVSDRVYQSPVAVDGEIVILGMDDTATEVFGPLPWDRSIYAYAIELLNEDPENAPTVIGVDVLFQGHSEDEDTDLWLAEAAGMGDNVVVACAALLGETVYEGENGFYYDGSAVVAWVDPFEELRDAADTGTINAATDTDGVLRHAFLKFYDEREERDVYSFSRVIYEKYCAAMGIEPNALPRTDERSMFYIPFSAEPGGYESYSIAELFAGTLDPEYFREKIVLIGPYAAGLMDEYVTSISPEHMYGVEINANLIDAFRRGFFPREASARLQLAVLFVLSAALTFFLWDRRVIVAIPVWLGVSLGYVGIAKLMYNGGNILHVLYVPLAATVIFVATVALNYVLAARERKKVTNTFGRYVDPAIMKQLLEKGGEELELGGKMYDIAVLFVDIRGFTTMSESLDPPTVVEIINQYLTLTTECIMRHHGTLDKFVGDCTMAFWNAPIAQEDAIYLACKAAMDMVEGSKVLGEELMRRFGRTVSFGVGVNYGPAVVGNIGAPKRMDYTAIGDTVNTAARLEANAPAGTVFISRVVADALGDRAKTTSLGGTIKLKGKADGFEILTLDELV